MWYDRDSSKERKVLGGSDKAKKTKTLRKQLDKPAIPLDTNQVLPWKQRYNDSLHTTLIDRWYKMPLGDLYKGYGDTLSLEWVPLPKSKKRMRCSK